MISPEKQTIGQILGDSRVKFSIPKYQREYDWSKSEINEMINDLKEVGDQDLFLGNFIFDVSDPSKYFIVDGQQRLTSISLLFIAAREHAKNLNELDFVKEIQDYISTSSQIRKVNVITIQVSPNIRDIYDYMADPKWEGQFPEKIAGKQIKRQVKKVKSLYNFIQDSLLDFNIDRLSSFITSILDAYAIVLKVENDQDVFSVFERTNARGLDLNIGDLIKNHIFSYQNVDLENKWTQIIENANGQLPRMLKYFWVSRNGHIQQSKLYSSLKEYINKIDAKTNEERVTIFVENLYEFSRYYVMALSLSLDKTRDWLEEFQLEVLSKNEDYYQRVGRFFLALKLFRVYQPLPLIFSSLKLFKDDVNAKPEILFKVLGAIENYHFINNVISGKVGNEVEKFYAESAKNIYNSKDSFELTMKEFIKGLQLKKTTKEDFISNFIENVSYSGNNFGLINYIFDKINNYKVKGAQYVQIFRPDIEFNKRNYNIEHILPQSLKENYSEAQKEKFDKIGNLIVISRHTNSTLSDKDPIDKIKVIESDKKHYGNLRYIDDFINIYRSEFNNWSFDSIDKRSMDIASMGYDTIWFF
jgi:uncharacterized protein with ParB-like and HNH nuclease domain